MIYEPPRILPNGWYLESTCEDGWRWLDRHPIMQKTNGSIILSYAKESDGKLWLHASMSRPGRVPSYEDLKLLKDVWIGRNRYAAQIFPVMAKHVNINPYVLHLFAPDDPSYWPLPDFTQGGSTL